MKLIWTVLGLLALPAFASNTKSRYCVTQDLEMGEFEGKIVPVRFQGRCPVANAGRLGLHEFKEAIRSKILADGVIVEAPHPFTQDGLGGTRTVFEYASMGSGSDKIRGRYELVLIDDGGSRLKGHIRSLDLKGQGLLGYIKASHINLQASFGQEALVTMQGEMRILKPAWAGTPLVFRKAVEAGLPGLISKTLGEFDREIDKLLAQ